jgi:hypothetical protein
VIEGFRNRKEFRANEAAEAAERTLDEPTDCRRIKANTQTAIESLKFKLIKPLWVIWVWGRAHRWCFKNRSPTGRLLPLTTYRFNVCLGLESTILPTSDLFTQWQLLAAAKGAYSA